MIGLLSKSYVKKIVGGILAMPAFVVGVAHASIDIKTAGNAIPGEFIVKINNQKSSTQMIAQKLSSLFGDKAVSDFRPLMTDDSLLKVKVSDLSKALEVKQVLLSQENVLNVEPNYMYYALDNGQPNDPDFNKLWGMKNTGATDSGGQVGLAGADIGVLPLWAKGITGSKKILVAVIDTGVNVSHPDLKDNVFVNPKEVAGNGKDDDNNGFVDDVSGWNFVDNTANSNDDHNHGTHCSGTIGGRGNNQIGVAGVNWEVSILPVKFLSASGGGSLEGAINSINYATKMGVQVMSNSWGGGGFSENLKTSIVNANKAGILFVAAAGNDGKDNDPSPTYPANYDVPNVLSVAATDNQDRVASFSNWGARTVHVAAPGVKIYSSFKDQNYGYMSGTSMATPHVAGIAALLLSADSSITPLQVKERLIKTSDPVRTLRRKVVANGRVNVFNSVNNIVPPSSEPDPSLWKTENFVNESVHPYANSSKIEFSFSKPGMKYVRVHFEKVDLENGYDKVIIKTPAGQIIEEVSGMKEGFWTDYGVNADGLSFNFVSDASVNRWGYKIDQIQYIQ